MSDQSSDRRTSPGTRSDAKTSVATTASYSLGAATLASTILYVVGCIKGHELYTPDDALLLAWCAGLIPAIQWFSKVIGLVGDIITRKLERDAAPLGFARHAVLLALGLVGCAFLAVILSSCAADGSLARGGKPIDKPATLQAVCKGISAGDAMFQTFAKVRPGVIDAVGMDVEGGAVALFYDRQADGTLAPLPICKAPYVGDVDAAIGSALNAYRVISAQLAYWQH